MTVITKSELNKKYTVLHAENPLFTDSGNNIQKKSCIVFIVTLTTISFAVLCMKTAIYLTRVRVAHGNANTFNNVQSKVYDASVEKVVSCYYNTPTPDSVNQLMPSNIHPHLCTHINVAFARVVDKKIYLEDSQYKNLLQLQQLKKVNPNLKILLSVGGAGKDQGFSDMVIDHASRKIFIKSIKEILRNYTLDGIDLDWEFPAIHDYELGVSKRERQHFSQLLQEIRREYIREKRSYLLTVAVAAAQIIVDVSYDVDQLNQYADYVNIMTYDYHYYSEYTPFTGLNSPLFARSTEQIYLSTLNINFTVHMYLDKGLSREKIVVGIPTYGHTFTLVNAGNTKVGSPSSGFGSLGSQGFINYPDICLFINSTSAVTVVQDKEAKVPYLYEELNWVSYDTPQSVIDKAMFIKDYNLRGAMIYSLNADDYDGVCGGDKGESVKFPLLQSVTNVLLKNTSVSDEEKGE